MNKQQNYKIEAVEKAIQIYEEIKSACTRPDKSIEGDTLKIYRELADWGFFEKYSIADVANKWLYVTVLAMHFMMKNNPLYDLEKKDEKGKWQIIHAALERSGKVGSSKRRV